MTEEAEARRKAVDRNDLFLLMESYRNTVELNTTLLQRQERINSDQQRIIQDLMGVCEVQTKILESVQHLPEEISAAIDTLCAATSHKCDHLQEGVEKQNGNLEEVKTAIIDHRIDSAQAWGGIRNRLYVAFAGSFAIIIALIGLAQKG